MKLWPLAICFALATPAAADAVFLIKGQRIEGKVRRNAREALKREVR